MDLNPTGRFSSRVADYVRFRPSYPAAMLTWLEGEGGLSPASRIADIGSGTGLLAALFLQYGCEVFGVEPNADMRRAGEQFLAGERRFHSIDGRAEDTGLPAGEFDFVTAGQAFHWFDIPAAAAEFRRILKRRGWIVLVWNERLVEGPFLQEYEALMQRYAPDYERVDHRQNMKAAAMDTLYGQGNWKVESFPNEQSFDLEGVLGRLHSSSYAPAPGTPNYEQVNAALTKIFAECQHEGRVAFRYQTKVYIGRGN